MKAFDLSTIYADFATQDDNVPSLDPEDIINAIRDGETVLLTDGPDVIGRVVSADSPTAP